MCGAMKVKQAIKAGCMYSVRERMSWPRINLPTIGFVNPEWQKVEKWCHANCGVNEWFWMLDQTGMSVFIHDSKKAMLFKLLFV